MIQRNADGSTPLTLADNVILARLKMPRSSRSANNQCEQFDAMQIADDMDCARVQGRGVVQRLHEKYGVPGFYGPNAAR